MAGRRKYRVGEHPAYDQAFDLHNMGSPILNNSRNTSFMNATTIDQLTTRRGLEHLLREWKGDEAGDFVKNGQKFPSKLKIAETIIKNLDEQFQQSQQAQINSGRRPAATMPPEMQTEKHRAEAVVDICLAEIAALERKLADFVESDSKISKGQVLQRGPQGSGKMTGGVLSVIDGQTVKQDAQGLLRISDERSPYHGMQTCDYLDHVVMPWRRAQDALRAENLEKAKQIAKDGGNAANIPMDALPPFPAWPENVKKETVK